MKRAVARVAWSTTKTKTRCNKVTLHFGADTHTYTLDGKVLPSVTTIIASDPSLYSFGAVKPEVLEAAAERGSNIHDYLHLWESSESCSVYEPFEPYRKEWLRFVVEGVCDSVTGPIGMMSEQPLAHTGHGFAGTPDRVYYTDKDIVIVDIKTGIESNAHRIQTAAYAVLALRHLRPTAPRFDGVRRVAVYLSASKPYKAVWHDDPTDFTAFMALRSLYLWKKTNGVIK